MPEACVSTENPPARYVNQRRISCRHPRRQLCDHAFVRACHVCSLSRVSYAQRETTRSLPNVQPSIALNSFLFRSILFESSSHHKIDDQDERSSVGKKTSYARLTKSVRANHVKEQQYHSYDPRHDSYGCSRIFSFAIRRRFHVTRNTPAKIRSVETIACAPSASPRIIGASVKAISGCK